MNTVLLNIKKLENNIARNKNYNKDNYNSKEDVEALINIMKKYIIENEAEKDRLKERLDLFSSRLSKLELRY